MTIADLIKKFTRPIAHEASTLEQAFAHAFGHEAAAVKHDATVIAAETVTVVHQAEKELAMALTQTETDIIARIAEAFSSHSSQSAADAQTISNLNAANADLTTQVGAKDAQIADLTQRLSDANSHLAEFEAAVAAAVPSAAPAPAPAPAPAADGSTSADVQP